MHPDDLQELPPGADRDDRKHRELDRQRDAQFQIDVEEEAKRLKERYGRQSRAAGTGSAIVPQRLLLPGNNDPRLFFMKCRPGKEKEVIMAIHGRVQERAPSRDPLKIYSAFERAKPGSPMAGMFYVEARRVEDVVAAVEGITHVFMSWKPVMVPLEEMPDLLKVIPDKQLQPGMYVRIKRGGTYQGDLALVEDIEGNGSMVVVRLVPRLDYGANEDTNAAPVITDADGKKRKRPMVKGPRPPPRLFNEQEAKKKHGRYLQKNGMGNNNWTYQNKIYEDGFLIETFRMNHLQTEDVNPTLEEVTKFAKAGAEDGGENLDLAALAATLKSASASEFLPGDKVEVSRGEQKGVSGRAVQVYGEVVKVKVAPSNGALSGQVIEVPIRDLRKKFQEGDHVKVIGGSKYIDEVGMVVRSKDDRVTVLTDGNQEEITVFSKDLREAADAGGASVNSKYSLFDLVQLDPATVGCVIKVDRESLRVLDQSGSVRTLLESAVANKLDRRKNAVATDRDGNEMKLEDTIKEYSGEQKSGRILHLHRNFVFAQDRQRSENAGVWVSRHTNVQVVAAKGGKAAGAGGLDLTKMNPAVLKPNGPAPAAMPPPQMKGRDRLIGKTVKLRSGQQKGLIGIVKDATADEAKVELHAKNKTITVKKEMLSLIDPKTGQVIQGGIQSLSMGRPPPAGANAGRTPGYAQPMGGRTPAYAMGAGGRTPAYAAAGGGGRTPAWKADAGAKTPAYGGGTSYGGGFGGATAYGGQTSYGGATSYGGGSVWGGTGGGVSSMHPLA
jgi:transcription elongation factor SPT5